MRVFFATYLLFQSVVLMAQDSITDYFAFKLIPVNPDVPTLCTLRESHYFGKLDLENWPVYGLDKEKEGMYEAGIGSAEISNFLDRRMVISLVFKEGVDTSNHAGFFVFLPVTVPVSITTGIFFELGTYNIYFRDNHDLPISDFFQCTQEGLPDTTLGRIILNDAVELIRAAPSEAQEMIIPFGKFEGLRLQTAIENLKANDVLDLMEIVKENALLYMGKNVAAGNLVVEWVYSGAPQSFGKLSEKFISLANRDSLYQANQKLIDNYFLGAWIETIFEYRDVANMDSAVIYKEVGKWLFGKTKNQVFIQEMELVEAKLWMAAGDYANSRKKLEKLLKVFQKNKWPESRINAIRRDLAQCWSGLNKSKNAEKIYQELIRDQRTTGDDLAYTLEEYAAFLQNHNRLQEAIDQLLKANTLILPRDFSRIAFNYAGIADLYTVLQMPEEASRYLLKSSEIMEAGFMEAE